MKVKLTCWRTCNGHSQRPGTVIDVSPEEARLLVKAGSAESVTEEIECAAVSPARTAVLPRPKFRRNQ
jgi:hypothetical protein